MTTIFTSGVASRDAEYHIRPDKYPSSQASILLTTYNYHYLLSPLTMAYPARLSWQKERPLITSRFNIPHANPPPRCLHKNPSVLSLS